MRDQMTGTPSFGRWSYAITSRTNAEINQAVSAALSRSCGQYPKCPRAQLQLKHSTRNPAGYPFFFSHR